MIALITHIGRTIIDFMLDVIGADDDSRRRSIIFGDVSLKSSAHRLFSTLFAFADAVRRGFGVEAA